jgi:hypothetical protein
MTDKTGGPAFPQMRVWNASLAEYEDTQQYPGMTLRDLTMVLCIAAVFGSRNEPLHMEKGETEEQALIRYWGSVAQAAAIAADAMLAERNK